MSLFFLATGEPVFDACHGDSRATALHTLKERREFADAMGSRKTGFIPGCLDHAGGELDSTTGTFTIPPEKQISRMVDTFVREDGQFLHTVEMFHEYPDISKRIEDDINNGKRWGVSLGKDLKIAPDRFDILSKEITHIGLTPTPQYGDAQQGGTWMNIVAKTPETFYTKLKEQLFDKEPGLYMPPQARERIGRLVPQKLVQVGASQALAQSDSPSPLILPLAALAPSPTPVAASTHEKVTFMAAAAPQPTDPMQGVTATTPAPAPITVATLTAAAAQAPQTPSVNIGAQFVELQQRVEALKKKTRPDPAKPPVISKPFVDEGTKLMQDMDALMTGLSVRQWSPEALSMLNTLVEYNAYSEKAALDHAQELFGNDPVLLNAIATAFREPHKKMESLDASVQVFASLSNSLKNTEEFNRQFSTQRAKTIQLENENITLKRERDEFEKELTAKKARLDVFEKEVRLDPRIAAINAAGSVPGATAAGLPASILPLDNMRQRQYSSTTGHLGALPLPF